MPRWTFDVTSEPGSRPYRVEVEINHRDELRVRCDCPAGAYRRWCHHVGAILSGDAECLAAPDEAAHEALRDVTLRVEGSCFSGLIDTYERRRREYEAAREALQATRARIERALDAGITLGGRDADENRDGNRERSPT